MREWKRATTRVGLAQALLERLAKRSLEDISVQEICETIPVSAATFFNYFPRKGDAVLYLTQLIQIDLGWHGIQAASGGELARIEAIFARSAELMRQHPWGMQEIISAQALMRVPPELPAITAAERAVAFPGAELEELPTAELLREAIDRALRAAVRGKELPRSVDIEAAGLGLNAIFFGIPMGFYWRDESGVGAAYARQLELMWKALGSRRRPTRRGGARGRRG